MLPEPGKQRI